MIATTKPRTPQGTADLSSLEGAGKVSSAGAGAGVDADAEAKRGHISSFW